MSYFAEDIELVVHDVSMQQTQLSTPATGTGSSTGVEITGYHLRLGGNRAVLELVGGDASGLDGGQPLARFDFRPGATPMAFENHGGFLTVTRPFELLAPTMDLLRHDAPVFLDANGTLTVSQRSRRSAVATF